MRTDKLKRAEFTRQGLTDKAYLRYTAVQDEAEQFYKLYDVGSGSYIYYRWDRCGEPQLIGDMEAVNEELEYGYETLVSDAFWCILTIDSNKPYSIGVLYDEDAEKPYKVIASLADRTQLIKFMTDYDTLTLALLEGSLEVPAGGLDYKSLRDILE